MEKRYISNLTEAAKRAGVTRGTLARWIKNYPELNMSVGKGYSIPVDVLDQVSKVFSKINGRRQK